MWLIKFIKNWTLLCSLIVGSAVYLTFSRIPLLEPIGDAVGPRLVDLMPYVIFTMLYLTFCKIDMHNFRPRKWHFALQGIRVLLTALVVIAINLVPAADHETKIILEGVFICVICPTAAAAPVLTEKLGGGIATMTVYMIIANIFSIIIIPTFFPMVERSAHITFGFAFLLVLKRVLLVLAVPLVLALLSQRFAPRVVEWVKRRHNLAFYLWSFNLSIIMGLAV
ncbi:bile acid:sodium symporter, partial [uncultured Prevotella sp.]|uniref:bile acid:sodium symporter n=1 Tax=uncultured Prevotella sp. TaxID=159272 RepID=UPI002597311F